MKKSEDDIRKEYFSDLTRWQSWLDVESALALVQSEIDIIPNWAATVISKKSKISLINQTELKKIIKDTGTGVFSLTKSLSNICGEAGKFVHWGATTQNIVDTGLLIVLKKYHSEMMIVISEILKKLSFISKTNSQTIMIGRTLSRHALPITYGFKVAIWIENFSELADQIIETEKRLFKLRFGGAVGGFHSYEKDGYELSNRLAKKLGLDIASVQDRTSPEPFMEYLMKLTMIGQLVKKIIDDFYFLNTEGIDEIIEVLPETDVGSSTMPQKINPKKIIDLKPKCNKLRQYLGSIMSFDLPSNEGDKSSNDEIRENIKSICPLALSVLYKFNHLLDVVKPNKKKMFENVKNSEIFTASEKLQMELAKNLGKVPAHDLVNDLVKEANSDQKKYRKLLFNNKFIKEKLSNSDLEKILIAENNIGECPSIANKMSKFGMKKSAEIFKKYQNGIEFIK